MADFTTTTVRIPSNELAELHDLADRAHISTQDAFRHGAKLYCTALLAPKTKRGRPKKETTNQ